VTTRTNYIIIFLNQSALLINAVWP